MVKEKRRGRSRSRADSDDEDARRRRRRDDSRERRHKERSPARRRRPSSRSPSAERRRGGRGVGVVKQEPTSDEERSRRADERCRRENEQRRREEHRSRPEGNPFAKDAEAKHSWGKADDEEVAAEEEEVEKQKPDFALSGKLAVDTNTYNGVVIKYNEPTEARKPKVRWRLYPFKGDEPLDVLYVHRQSAYLIGRDRRIADLPVDHPSCSKQHAALQYRAVKFDRADGTTGTRVRPYLIDLGSANGSFLNNERMDARRYYELQERDVIKFGFSSREYVVLNEESHKAADDDDDDDDEQQEQPTADQAADVPPDNV